MPAKSQNSLPVKAKDSRNSFELVNINEVWEVKKVDKIESIMRILPQSVREIFVMQKSQWKNCKRSACEWKNLLCVLYEGKSSLSTMQAECREEYRGHIL